MVLSCCARAADRPSRPSHPHTHAIVNPPQGRRARDAADQAARGALDGAGARRARARAASSAHVLSPHLAATLGAAASKSLAAPRPAPHKSHHPPPRPAPPPPTQLSDCVHVCDHGGPGADGGLAAGAALSDQLQVGGGGLCLGGGGRGLAVARHFLTNFRCVCGCGGECLRPTPGTVRAAWRPRRAARLRLARSHAWATPRVPPRCQARAAERARRVPRDHL